MKLFHRTRKNQHKNEAPALVKPVAGEPVRLQSVPRAMQITMALAIILGMYFVRTYVGVVLFSALIAFTFNPVYKAVLRKTKRQGLALTTTILTALVSLIVPIAIIVFVSIGQANTLLGQLRKQNIDFGSTNVTSVINQATDKINKIADSTPVGKEVNVKASDVNKSLKQAATAVAQGFVNFLKSAGGAVSGIISMVILGFFMIASMLRYQKELLDFLRRISPLHDSVTDLYFRRAGAMTKAMVKGQLVIALVQGLAGAFSLWIVGVDYFWFFFIVLSFLSFIPLGSGILTLPLGVVLLFTNGIPAGIFVLAFHILVVTNIDNLLRPRLVPKEAQLNSALLLLAVFSGLAAFGPAGVIYGPVVMILLTTTYQVYAQYVQPHHKAPAPPAAD